MIGVDRVGGQGDSALTIQISQAGWTDVIYLSCKVSSRALQRERSALKQWTTAMPNGAMPWCNKQSSPGASLEDLVARLVL